MGSWIRRKLDELSTQLLGTALLAAALAIGAATWAAILNWDGPTVILLIVGLIAGTLFSVDRGISFYRQLTPSARPPDEATLRNWAYELGHSVHNEPNPQAIFQFVARYAEREVAVAQSNATPEFVSVHVRLPISAEDQVTLAKITAADDALIADLRIEMARLGVEYEGISHPLQAIRIETKLLLDPGLTKLAFMESIMFIHRARVLLETVTQRAVARARMA